MIHRRLEILVGLFALILPLTVADGQDFLKNLLTKSPGPLSKAHQEYDNISNCIACHVNKLGGDLALDKCTDCHQEIKSRLDEHRGYHRGKTECQECHAEHKGLNTSTFAPKDWLDDFDHEVTGYGLLGKHEKVECLDCHKQFRKHPKTKEVTTTHSYLDAPKTCVGCHEKDYEHNFSKKTWQECTLCHSSLIPNWKEMASKLKFKHDETRYPLEGKHIPVKCLDCHKPDAKKKRVTAFAPLAFGKCTDCHADPHKGSFGNSCIDCHSVYRAWKDVTAIKTKSKSKDKKGNSKEETKSFDHQKTNFPLVGYHEATSCEGCHFDSSTKFKMAKDRYDDCSDCHGFPHNQQFKGQSCENCHKVEKKFLDSSFDLEQHNKTNFKLTGMHQVLDCQKCHFSGNFEKIPSAQCSDCHNNPHNNREIDKTCDFCHVTTSFSWIQFDHSRNTNFKLTGKHRDVACVSCHVLEIFKNMPANNTNPNCSGCHASPHGSSISQNCQDCHRTEGFKFVENFNHEKLGKWKLQGRHAELTCQKCHSEHLKGSYQITSAPGVDQTACSNCHADIHEGKHGKDCQSCHNFFAFGVSEGEKIHDIGFFKLKGSHDKLGCADCHRPDTNLQGMGIVCGNCHRKNDPHLGKLGPTCGDCHRQTTWLPTTFKHNQTGFKLAGAHRFVDCSNCHKNQTYEGLPSDCYFCHSDSYIPNSFHSRSSVADCNDCHSPLSWKIRKGGGLNGTSGGGN